MDDKTQGLRELEKQTFHWLVIREKKNKDRDAQVKLIHATFKSFAKEFAMDNYTMALDKLLVAYMKPMEFDMLEDRINSLELRLTDLADLIETKSKETKETKELKVLSTL